MPEVSPPRGDHQQLDAGAMLAELVVAEPERGEDLRAGRRLAGVVDDPERQLAAVGIGVPATGDLAEMASRCSSRPSSIGPQPADQSGGRPDAASRSDCGSPPPAARGPVTPADRYSSSRSANHAATSATSSGVQGAVLAGRRGEIPPVDQVVGAQLADVLGGVLVAVREVNLVDAGEQLVDSGRGIGCCVPAGSEWIVAEQVAVEAVTDLGDRHALQQRPGPAILPDDVVDEGTHVPLGARRRQRPLIGADAVEVSLPGLHRPLVQRVQVHRHLPSSQGCQRSPSQPPNQAGIVPNHELGGTCAEFSTDPAQNWRRNPQQ